ncbi:MAG: hypothetical protein JF597_50625 [Streptomyces sp.]|uniref:hypothetical protein n=1 Tax=Streptomyces sp. TaxID=1931 RepID=UPI0025E97481|nr:hypothetical protein [Streptomyces sp.]MBW8801504.1 hypothetical protein [Streptomyces sp.]
MKLLAVSAIAVTAMGLTPATASAATDPLGVGIVRNNDYQRGLFAVPVWTNAPSAHVDTVTATIRDGATTITTVPLTEDAQSPGLWEPDTALSLTRHGGAIPDVGRYAIDVTAHDTADDSVTRTDAGTLDFTFRPEFDQANGAWDGITFTRPTLDATHRSTTATGVLLGVEPGAGGVAVPLEGETVTVTRRYTSGRPGLPADASYQVTTGADGGWTTGDLELVDWTAFTSSFTADTTRVHGTATGSASPGFAQTPVTVTAHTNRSRFEPGQSIVVTGKVLAGSQPVVGLRVALNLSPYQSNEPERVVVTDARGNFSGTVVAVPDYWVTWSASTDDAFYDGSTSGEIKVPAEAAYSHVSIVLAATGTVTARATLDRLYPDNASLGRQRTDLQYSRDGKTAWKSIAHVTPDYYSAVVLTTPGYSDGYYRLYHPASDDLAHAYSAVYHRSRIPTRVTGNDAGPEPIRSGRTLTVRGTLQEYRGGWRTMGHKHVELWFLANGAKRWSYVSSGTTDSRGRAVLHGTATKSGKWIVQYWADTAHFNSYATADPVAIR